MRELISFIAAVFIHEGGHILCALISGIPMRDFSLKPCGAVMSFDYSKASYLSELAVHISGPLAGILSASLAIPIFGKDAVYFAGVSIFLAAVNLLPLRGFDGGGALFCLMSHFFSPYTAYTVCRLTGIVCAVLVWLAVVRFELRISANIGLIIFTAFIWKTALDD